MERSVRPGGREVPWFELRFIPISAGDHHGSGNQAGLREREALEQPDVPAPVRTPLTEARQHTVPDALHLAAKACQLANPPRSANESQI